MKTVVTQIVASVTLEVPSEWSRGKVARELANAVVWSKDDPQAKNGAALRKGQLHEVRFGALTESDFTIDGAAQSDEKAAKAAAPATA